MSDTTVRAAIVAYFQNAAPAGIARWYKDEPWTVQAGGWKLANQGGWGALAYVHLDDAQERRETFGGTSGTTPTGMKSVMHTVSLLLWYRYLIPPNKTAASEDDWVGPLDTLIDEVKTLIRADPSLGTGSIQPNPTINWAGQSRNGNPDIRQTRDLPVTDTEAATVMSWNRITFDLYEFITA